MASPSKPLSVSNVFKAVAPVPAVRRCYLTLGLVESQRHGIGPNPQSSEQLRAHALSFVLRCTGRSGRGREGAPFWRVSSSSSQSRIL